MENKWFAICGSRNANRRMRDYAKSATQHALDNGWVLLVGDNHRGVDRAVIAYAFHNGYGAGIWSTGREEPRAIASLKGRNVRSQSTKEHYTLRDRTMLEFADALMCIWDGKSHGTYANFQYARELGIEVWLVDFSKKDRKTGDYPRVTHHEDERTERARLAALPKQAELL